MDHSPEHSHAHSHEHDHDHDHDHGHDHAPGRPHLHFDPTSTAPRVIVQAMAVTVVFMVIEAAGGILSNSLALLSDAGHMLTDVGALLLSLFALWVARRPTTKTMSFGYHRAEILGALASGLMIWLISGLLVYEAAFRLQNPPEVKGPMVFVIAAIGLAANLLSMKLLHRHKHDNINVRAAYLHMVADSLGSVGAIVAGAVLWLTGWRPIDPIVTILFAALMLYSSWHLVSEAVAVLMESTPPGVDPHEIQTRLEGIPGVKEVHDLHVWTVSVGRLALSVHLIAADEKALGLANAILKSDFGIVHTTIQVEHPDHFQSERCYDCR